MSLSDRDRDILKGLEDSLFTSDPKLSSIMAANPRVSRSLLSGVALVIVGLLTLFSGLVTKNIILGIFGFPVALVGVTILFSRFGFLVKGRESKLLINNKGFFQNLENRWDNRNFNGNN